MSYLIWVGEIIIYSIFSWVTCQPTWEPIFPAFLKINEPRCQVVWPAANVGLAPKSWKISLAACRGKSTADLIAKLSIVLEEADESLYWMELLIEAELIPAERLQSLMRETNEIVAMLVASLKTLRSKSNSSRIYSSKSKI